MSSKMDWEDEYLLMNIRMGFFGLMGTLGILTAYVYMQLKGKPADRTVIYVKKPPSMTEPAPKWEKTTYAQHDMSEIMGAATQLGMALAMTSVMHFYFGVKQSMLMQGVMVPVSYLDNGAVKKYLLGDKGRVYDEKLEGEDREEVAEETAAPPLAPAAAVDDDDDVPRMEATEADGDAAVKQLIQDTWDLGKAATYGKLMLALTRANVNVPSPSEATALMIVAAGVGDVAPYVHKLLALGASTAAVDDEGWTALHWAAYHGNLSGATALCAFAAAGPAGGGGATAGAKALVAAQDLEGKTALDLAKEELADASGELKALQAAADDSELGKQQADAKATQVATKAAIVGVLEKAAAGGGGGGFGVPPDEEGIEEID